MKITNSIFKYLVFNYYKTFKSIESFSLMHWADNLLGHQIRLKLVWSLNFFMHSLGFATNSTTGASFELNKQQEFVRKLMNNEIHFDDLIQTISKRKRANIYKKLLAIIWLLKRLKNTEIFQSFKLKPQGKKEKVYTRSECIIIGKYSDNKVVAMHCLYGNNYGLNINKHKSIYWNISKQTKNIVVIPFSIKLMDKRKLRNDNLIKIDWSFVNFYPSKG
ncbi:hypothetical protein MCFN_01085 [Mycoplasmopsis californica]|uniref:Uncharacterized protein n=2 Tax=Mycoplasmopsis californica TaxID=2113 RepID=A0A059XRG0_9BACT|nr:hypothetical protein MCFN_01085 [Mycoplasmopsis californica]